MIRHSLAALAVICMAAPTHAQTAEPATISVNGEATISVPPDLAQIDGGVTTTAKTAREASEANNKTMGVVLLALKNTGIAEKDFQTSRLSLQPETSTRTSGGPTQIVGYRASNRVTVTIRDTGKLANVIDTLVSNGANDISGISFSVSNTSKLLDEARVEALADARRKAEIYARAAGVSLGAPLSISENGGPAPIAYRRAVAPMAAAPIAQGEERLRIGVAVSYEIKPKTP